MSTRSTGAPGFALAALALLLAAATPARGALPSAYGGVLRLPAPEPVATLDPAEVSSPFSAALAASVCETLYRVGPGGIEPVLAAGPPTIEGRIATIRLRSDLRRHVGTPLRASAVVASLRRASHSPRAGWLLGGFEQDGGEPDVRAVGDEVLEVRLRNARVDVARVLSATSLAIATGRDRRRRPLGTGPFTVRFTGDGTIDLRAFAFAAEGAPYLARIVIPPPSRRDDALRAFELGRVDFSWHGESLYGGRPVRPVRSTRLPEHAPVLLVPGRSGVLRDEALWSGVARAIDRRRLERVGIAPTPSLAPGLSPPRLGAGRRPSSRTTLRMPVVAGDGFQVALAEALAGPLDEAGYELRVDQLTPERYANAVARGGFDLRIVTVVPPLPGATAIMGAALAETGQIREALSLSRDASLRDPAAGAALAPRLRALVLGRRRAVVSHRADLAGLHFDALGRLDLPSLSLPREAR